MDSPHFNSVDQTSWWVQHGPGPGPGPGPCPHMSDGTYDGTYDGTDEYVQCTE